MPTGPTWDRLTFGPARRRREMHRRLAALDRLDAQPVHASRRSGYDRARPVLVAVVVLAVLAGWLGFLQPDNAVSALVGSITHSGPAPLGRPPATDHGAGVFEFMSHQRGAPDEPVAYDPCRKIAVVIDADQAPAGADEIVRRALAETSAATGLVFRVEGATDERATANRPLRDRARYGNRWSPVLIAWTNPAEVPELAGRVTGLGGSAAYGDGVTNRLRYVTGAISLDSPQITQLLQRPDGARLAQAIVMHELGHVVGLNHVDDPRELMYGDNVGQLTWGYGDREGLAALGSGHCFGRGSR